MLIAPTEPKALRELGLTSSTPEHYGCDVLWKAHDEWWGVQRKEVKDFVASAADGRLAYEVAQMKQLGGKCMLIMEGKIEWSGSGSMMGREYGQPWTQQSHQGLICSLQNEGVWYLETPNTHGTGVAIKNFVHWSRKEKHAALVRRVGPRNWGTSDNKEWVRHLVQGLPKVGPEIAGRIVEKYGCPFEWRISREDLLRVEGIGKKRADELIAALEGTKK